jgi:tRNA A-37 threonylcarbamoyl transferase component Bud32
VSEADGLALARLPERFGKYSILGHLATGGMAEVYLARQTGLEGFEKTVVIKRVRPELLADREVTDSFLDEARLVATLQHPNIAQVYEIGIVNDTYFLVMEYVPGGDVRQLMERSVAAGQPIAIDDAIYIVIQACVALHYAHEKRGPDGERLDIIHRDVSPSNVLLSHDGAVKVCDFGIAKTTSRTTTETARGALKGKSAYMSPEQCQAGELDRRSDIFTLGILLYELSTLTRAFHAPSDFEMLRTIIERPVTPPSRRAAHYPRELERIVLRALAKDPAERYPTAQAMQLDLEELAREHKLALSSVNIARLVGERFEHRELPRADPPPAEVWTAPAAGTPRDRSAAPALPAVAPEPGPRRHRALWWIGALAAGLVAGGVSLAGRVLDDAAAAATASALDADAERLASALDVGLRSARMRATGIAATPVLHTAIDTDAATMKDLAEKEYVFSAGKGETVEVFQLHGGAPGSVLRLPSGAAGLPPMTGLASRLESSGPGIAVVAGAPIAGTTGIAGEVVVATQLDLSPAIRQLAQHVAEASLRGPGVDVRLVAPSPERTGAALRGTPRTLALPITRELGGGELALVAVPIATATSWVAPARLASLAAAALVLAGYLIAILAVRRRR